MYKGSKIYFKHICGTTEYFKVGVGVHLGHALSYNLFFVVIDVVMKEIQGEQRRIRNYQPNEF